MCIYIYIDIPIPNVVNQQPNHHQLSAISAISARAKAEKAGAKANARGLRIISVPVGSCTQRK